MDAQDGDQTVQEIENLAENLKTLKASLGGAYWSDAAVISSQARLRKLLGLYGAWAEDRPALHQRARRLAQYESRFAHLLWAGRETDAG